MREHQNTPPTQDGKLLRNLAWLVPILLVLAAVGSQRGWWDYTIGLLAVKWITLAGMLLILLAVVAFIAYSIKKQTRGQRRALAAFILCVIPVAFVLHQAYWAARLPRIHDITTDTKNPPQFTIPIPNRLASSNSLTYEGPAVAAQQLQAYPDIHPLILDADRKEAMDHIVRLIKRNRWELIGANAVTGQVEAVARSFWFGFNDDVVFRVTPVAEGSRIDMRSVSRIGRGDVGANAGRIERFMQELADVHNQEKARVQK